MPDEEPTPVTGDDPPQPRLIVDGDTNRIGRRWRSFSPWKRVLVLLAVAMSPCLLCCTGLAGRAQYIQWFVLTPEDRAYFKSPEHREGVPSVARKLIGEFAPFDDPDQAVATNPDWFAYRFPNGEWVFGHGVDSHGFRVGHGTLVVKDSRGATRVFFGHVCGKNSCLPGNNMGHLKGLDTFYPWVVSLGLLEWFP